MCVLLGVGCIRVTLRGRRGADIVLVAGVWWGRSACLQGVCVSVLGILVNAVQTGSPALIDTSFPWGGGWGRARGQLWVMRGSLGGGRCSSRHLYVVGL